MNYEKISEEKKRDVDSTELQILGPLLACERLVYACSCGDEGRHQFVCWNVYIRG
jgi:hypothetical protein